MIKAYTFIPSKILYYSSEIRRQLAVVRKFLLKISRSAPALQWGLIKGVNECMVNGMSYGYIELCLRLSKCWQNV